MGRFKKRSFIVALSIALSFMFAGCEKYHVWETVSKNLEEAYEISNSKDIPAVKESGIGYSDSLEKAALFDYLAGQEYTGSPYVCVNGNIPYFTKEEMSADNVFEFYARLDDKGRTGPAFAALNVSLMPVEKEERENINSVTPAGWVQEKYDSIDNGGWLYNRCHLIAWSLAGENDNEKNLMTGTRYFNVEGMLPFEMDVLEYLNLHPKNRVLYRATPVYEGDNLVADGLLLEAYSIEDEGELAFCVYLFNVQPGIEIDYKTGESREKKTL